MALICNSGNFILSTTLTLPGEPSGFSLSALGFSADMFSSAAFVFCDVLISARFGFGFRGSFEIGVPTKSVNDSCCEDGRDGRGGKEE